MDYQQSQSHHYMRPPPPPPPPPQAPPPAADPYQRQAPPPPPPWTYQPQSQQQFQYQPQSQHSPSPPPPPPQYAAAPPHYPAHQPPPYHAQPHYPPQHQLPPRPPPVHQPYAQEWGNGSWNHHQSWAYPINNNEEDWAAKARAWAAKSATDNQHPPPQFTPAGRPEGQNHFHDQYSQPIDPQFHTPLPPPASSYQPYPVGAGPPNRSGTGQLQESHYISSEQASYATDSHAPYNARDSTTSFPQQEKSSISPLVHQQEVPSSYSSVAGNGAGDRYENFNSSSGLPVASGLHHHVQPLPSSGGRSGWMEEHHQLHGSRPAEPVTDQSDQPLNFAPNFSRDFDPHLRPSYNPPTGDPLQGDHVGVSPNYSWAPFSAPGVVYPPVPPKIPSVQQIDHSIAMPPPASGHSTALFPTGPGFQPSVPMIGSNFGVGPGVSPHSIAFSGDAYGVSSVSERPKKASVPNWLREEIIKNKASITSSVPELPKEDSEPVEDDSNDGTGYQVDRRSIDSSRSIEDENEDEEEVEVARTAAINQEIKRVLTEVLLKVTDELFDEIATKVLKEDDVSVEVGISSTNHQVLPPTQAVSTPKASARILIPTKGQEVDLHEGSEKSSSGSPGDILGLGNYASDEDDDGIQSSNKLNSKDNQSHLPPSSSKDLEEHTVARSGSLKEATEEPSDVRLKLEIDGTVSNSAVAAAATSVANAGLNDARAARELVQSDNLRSSKRPTSSSEDELPIGSDRSKSNKSVSERDERPGGLEATRLGDDDSRIHRVGNRSDKHDRHENKRSGKDHSNSESTKERLDKKGDEENKKHVRDDTKYYNGSKDKGKDKGKSGEKTKDSEPRKRSSPSDDKERTSRRGRDRREGTEENRQDKLKDEKRERSRHKNGSDSGRHKRRRSSSIGDRGRESKDKSVTKHAKSYSDESSDDSKRKSRHSKRYKSPSPIRSRNRQVSRSPHSKHSKRRHSPYSSLETTRGKGSPSRSRSRSPVNRRR